MNTPENRGGQEREVIARKLASGEVQRDERKTGRRSSNGSTLLDLEIFIM